MEVAKNLQPVGSVAGLWRFPVKSMGAEALAEAEVSWQGIAGDRRWAFVREGVVQSGFPWLTLRQRAEMSRYLPSFADPSRPDQSPTLVRTPSGLAYDVADPALAAELWPGGARVIRNDRGNFDAFPLSLITRQTVEWLGGRVGSRLDALRFRPNLLVDAAGGEPFAEEGWVGRVLRIGEMRLRVDQRDGRCMVITLDPASGERNPAILRTVAQERDSCLGVYGSTVAPGRVALGDQVAIEDPLQG